MSINHPPVAEPAGSAPAPPAARKGRGTVWAIAHRFEREQREAWDDGWGSLDQAVTEEALAPTTEIIEERVRSILSRNSSPDIPFDLSINPYRGCEHVITRQRVCD